MRNLALITAGKLLANGIQRFNLGNGSTWPGHIALKANKQFLNQVLQSSSIKTILVAGTNGKTTTTTLIKEALEANGKTVIQNESGANLLNGIAATLLTNTNAAGKLTQDYALFEVDENALPLLLKEMKPDYLLLLNLFRDQLDRYGEIDSITSKWQKSLQELPEKTKVILNADDPQIAWLGLATKRKNTFYFGLQSAQFGNEKLQHAADSVSCPKCSAKLVFEKLAFSHLGEWHCKKCGLKRPDVPQKSYAIYPLSGLYNKYNILAARKVLKLVGLTEEQTNEAFINFKPAFGRQEVVEYKGKLMQLFLSKNPTSFNQSYTTIQELGGKTLLVVLNDRIPDGRDVSWIWDVDLPNIHGFKHILVAGDRVYDMALRLKYEGAGNFETFENLNDAIQKGISLTEEHETFFILPTYSAMLETRKILTGKKIL